MTAPLHAPPRAGTHTQPAAGLAPATAVAGGDLVCLDNDGRTLAARLSTGPLGSLFVSASWIEALTATYDFNVKASFLRPLEESTGAAILFSEIDDIRGRRVVSLPFSDYCDPFVENVTAWNRLIDPILALQTPVRFRLLRNSVPLSDSRFTHSANALWHMADLRRSEDELWSGLKDSAPQNVRRAQRSRVVIREGTSLEDLQTFYRMHCSVRRSKYRLFAQPFAFFENLYSSFADQLVVLLAEVDGTAIAGILFLIHGDTLYYKFNASIDLTLRPNDLLIWSGMRLGRERGLSALDFGLSDTAQPGLVRFKRKFATSERPIIELRWSPPDYSDPRGHQAGEVLHRMTEILTAPEVPEAVTRGAGDELYRFFC